MLGGYHFLGDMDIRHSFINQISAHPDIKNSEICMSIMLLGANFLFGAINVQKETNLFLKREYFVANFFKHSKKNHKLFFKINI